MRRLMNQHGLSLVEVMIILVVVGVLLGGSLLPFGAILQGEAYEAEESGMRRFHDAIIGYAITHRTRDRWVTVSNDSGERRFPLPGDRPYLPCPDIDGDGYEDRYRKDSKDNRNFDDIGLIGPPEGITMSISADRNELLYVGGCVSARGILPWRTLGVRPHDRWGNRYTYEVDEIFSNAMVGFDETAVIDSFDVRKTMTLSSRTTGKLVYDRRDEEENPIVICDEALTTSICQANGASPEVMIVGLEVVNSALSGPRRDFKRGDIRRALPYVIVSHGRNGHGAVNHRFGGATIRCRYPTNDPPGISNPTYDVDASGNQLFYDEAVNFPQVGLLDEDGMEAKWDGCSEIEQGSTPLVNGFFVHKLRYSVYKSDHSEERHYDDIVIWVTVGDLVRELTLADVLPAPELPVFRGY